MLIRRRLLGLLALALLLTQGGAQLNLLKQSKENEHKFESDKDVVLNVRKHYGPEGDRVQYDEFDRPFILCSKYNPNECNPAKDSTCPQQERCYPENQ